MIFRAFAVAAALVCLPAHARVFDIQELKFAPYIRGTFGDSWVHQEPFIHELGSTTVDGTSTYQFSGELGFLFSVAKQLNIRIGAEIMQPNPVNGNGTNTSGTALFRLNSSMFIFNPQAAAEFIVKQMKESRVIVTAGAGYATVNVKNAYSMTSAGQTQFGMGSYTEDMTDSTMDYFGSVGWEFRFTDRIMILPEVGYRYFKVSGLTHAQPESTIAQPGGAAKGSPVLNSDGSGRHFDLSGAFLGFSMRFYLQ